MTSKLIGFFQKHLAQHAGEVAEHIKSHRARLSAAALLVEVVNADGEFTDDERRALFVSLKSQFALSSDEATDLLAVAEQHALKATDLFEFTASINQSFTPEQKRDLIEELWRAAYADEVLSQYEELLVRKVGDLLHVPYTSVLLAKQRAQAASEISK